jgi:hypothetical protein
MSVKDIQIKPIAPAKANEFIKKHHYSGKVVSNSQLHLGAYYHGSLGGVLQFGPPMVRDHLIDLVEGTGWNEMLELNRMAFTDDMPTHSGSRILGITFRLFKKHAPHVKWVVSFADATRCGDGAVYRASNFVLTQIKPNKAILEMPNGETVAYPSLSSHPHTPRPELGGKTFLEASDNTGHISVFMRETGAEWLEGYQLRYIYFIDKSYRERLTVPEIPYEEIDNIGAGMYKGEKVSVAERKEQARR